MELELDLARNMLGPLNEEYRARLRALLDNPTVDTWDDAYCLLLAPTMTVWQAVCAVDPSYMNIGKAEDLHGRTVRPWGRIPDRRTIERALFYATH